MLGAQGWAEIKTRIDAGVTKNGVFSYMATIADKICEAVMKVRSEDAPLQTTRLVHRPYVAPHGTQEGPQGQPDGQFVAVDAGASEHLVFPEPRRSPRGHPVPLDMNEILDVISLEEYKVSATLKDTRDVSLLVTIRSVDQF
jgi:hypothetical protein